MKIESPRFGAIEVSPDRVIEFPSGLPGFEKLRRFSLFHPEGGRSGQFILQSLEDAEVALQIADPQRFGFAYEIHLSEDEVGLLQLADPVDAAVAVVLSDDGGAPRANLKAPLIINTRARLGLQFVSGRLIPASRRRIVATPAAPAAIGTYSQAVRVGETVYMSGQIGLDPATMQMVEGIDAQIVRVFENLKAVAEAAGASLDDAVKFNIYLTDLANFAKVNEVMAKYVAMPYPARAAVGVAALPRGALVEADAVLFVG